MAHLVPLRGRIHRPRPTEPAPRCAGPGGRFPAICGMPLLPIVMAIGCEGRATTGSDLASPSSRVPHEISGLVSLHPTAGANLDRLRNGALEAFGSFQVNAEVGRLVDWNQLSAPPRLGGRSVKQRIESPTVRLFVRPPGWKYPLQRPRPLSVQAQPQHAGAGPTADVGPRPSPPTQGAAASCASRGIA